MLQSKLEDSIFIRPATPIDISYLPEIESSASIIFKSVPELSFIASDPPLSSRDLNGFLSSGLLWVAVPRIADSTAIPAAFLAAKSIRSPDRANSNNAGSTYLYIAECSVHSSYQRRGIAKALFSFVEEYALVNGFEGMTLITFLDIPWNGGFYRKLGFVDVDAEYLGEDYVTMLEEERGKWEDWSVAGTWKRGVMLKKF